MSLYPEPNNVTNATAAIQYTNEVSSGAIGMGIPVSVFAIILIVGIIRKNPIDATFTSASVIFTILSSLLAWANLLNPLFAVAGIILSGLGVIWMKLSTPSN